MKSNVARALSEIDRSVPSGSVITDPDVLAAYACDESEVQPHVPDAVVRVRSSDQTAALMRACWQHDVNVTPRAGGTGRTGGAVPVEGGIVVAFEAMNALDEIDREDMVAVVQPGLVLGNLHAAVEQEGLFYGPDPNSWGSCALGGNLAENAGGPRAFKYGVTRDWALGLEVVTADGTQLSLGKRTVKGVTGYDLAALVVGSEGTLALITRATLKLIPKPEQVVTLLALLPDLHTAGRAVTELLRLGIVPRCIELLDGYTLDLIRPKVAFPISAAVNAALLVELDGSVGHCDAELERAGNAMASQGAIDVLVAKNSSDRERLWSARRELSRALRASARHKLAEDVVVPRSQIANLLSARDRISEQFAIRMPTYGHAGDGNLHVNFLWDDPSEEPAVHSAIEALFREVIRLRGTLSGEHGIGVLKAPYLALEQSPQLIDWQKRVKHTFDPKGILNPGKIFPTSHGSC